VRAHNALLSIYPEGLAFVPPFLEGHGAFQVVCDRDLAPTSTVRIGDLNRRFRGLQPEVSPSPGLRFACWQCRVNADDTEAPAVRDVDVAPLVTAGGLGPLSNRDLVALTRGLSRLGIGGPG
jgi:hypothetical protein